MPPLKFLIFFLVSAAILVFLSMLYSWELLVSLSLEQKNNLLLFLPAAASGIVFPAASSGLLFSVFDYRKEAIKPVSAAITAAAIFLVLYFGFTFTSSMISSNDIAEFQPFNERKIHMTENSIIYTDECDSDIVSGIIIRNHDGSLPGFKYYDRAVFSSTPGAILQFDDARSMDIVPANPVFYDSFRRSGMIGNYIDDIRFMNESLKTAALNGGGGFILLAAVFSAFLMIGLLFRGASSWPLFDFALILFFHRLVYYLFRLFSSESTFIADTFFGGKQELNIPLFTISGLTLILFLCGVLVKTTSKRKVR